LQGISRALADDGILFLGPAEPPILPAAEWRLAAYPMSFSCVKRPATALPVRPTATRTPKRPHGVKRPAPSVKPSAPSAPPGSSSLLEKATALADSGKLAEAKKVLHQVLVAEPHNPQAHCLMGIVEEAAGEIERAEACYRKAIYLHPAQIDALQHMVLLLERQGRAQAAAQWRRRALKYATP
jgi:chemotaxis protein methyltransferase WspC